MDQAELQKALEIMDQRFGHDTLLSVATLDGGKPAVRTVDGYYENGAFYTITYALSGKIKQLEIDPSLAVCGEWFTAKGVGENLGWVRDEKNAEIADKLRTAFAAWYANGHANEEDPNTVVLKMKLTDGVLMCNGKRYDIDFRKIG